MKILESAENYMETILVLKKQNGYVRAVDIANTLDFTKPSVSVAMKNLRENGYITIDGGNHIELTPKGLEIAERTYKRHILITKVLVSMGIDQEIASADACKIEHIVSQETIDAMEKFLEKL